MVDTGRPARKSDSLTNAIGGSRELARDVGVHTVVGAPVFVDERVWGVMMAASRTSPLPPDTEGCGSPRSRTRGHAISNATRRRGSHGSSTSRPRCAGSRRWSRAACRGQVFAATARELGRCCAAIPRTMVAAGGRRDGRGGRGGEPAGGHVPVDTRVRVDGVSVAGTVLRTRAPRRARPTTSWTPGDVAQLARGSAWGVAGAPVIVDGRVWGVMLAGLEEGPSPPDTEARIAAFSELAGTAVSNADAKTRVARLADEQEACGAWRRWSRAAWCPTSCFAR